MEAAFKALVAMITSGALALFAIIVDSVRLVGPVCVEGISAGGVDCNGAAEDCLAVSSDCTGSCVGIPAETKAHEYVRIRIVVGLQEVKEIRSSRYTLHRSSRSRAPLCSTGTHRSS